ncbi:hypothetical protein [Aquimarina sediminis]|uniref:hypothetical protein n=1 Tax=Aquimarina sediminis TaxID=2070536 RepID=UPI000FFEEF42|nr:hypothetical protein [Aquimarina sediminis]
MKKILTLICFVFMSMATFAQNGPRERIKAFKVAYITEKLNLSSSEAQQFWPIYNAHEETIETLRKRERKLMKALREENNGPDGLTDKRAGNFLDEYLKAEEQKSISRKKLVTDLKKVLSNKKILRLIKAEADFHKRMLDRIKERKKRH